MARKHLPGSRWSREYLRQEIDVPRGGWPVLHRMGLAGVRQAVREGDVVLMTNGHYGRVTEILVGDRADLGPRFTVQPDYQGRYFYANGDQLAAKLVALEVPKGPWTARCSPGLARRVRDRAIQSGEDRNRVR